MSHASTLLREYRRIAPSESHGFAVKVLGRRFGMSPAAVEDILIEACLRDVRR